MEETQRQNFMAMLDDIEASDEARSKFLDNPIATLNQKLGLGLDDHISRTPVANKLLIAALKEEGTTQRLQEATSDYQNGNIDLEAARRKMAEALLEAAGPGTDKWLEDLRNKLRPELDPALLNPALVPEKFDPQAFAIPNIAAAVDIVVVVTESAIVNSEVFFTGRGRNDAMDVRRIARTLAVRQ